MPTRRAGRAVSGKGLKGSGGRTVLRAGDWLGGLTDEDFGTRAVLPAFCPSTGKFRSIRTFFRPGPLLSGWSP